MQLLNDIRNYYKLTLERKIYLIAFLAALSGIFSVLDAMIPKPIPFVKIGIANIVSLILVREDKLLLALNVAVLRTIVSSLFIGTFLSYTFLLSFTGAVVSLLFMWLFFKIFGKNLSEVGLSVIGAFFNTAAQGLLVFLFWSYDRGTLFLVSILILASLVNGIIIGFLAKMFYKEAEKIPTE